MRKVTVPDPAVDPLSSVLRNMQGNFCNPLERIEDLMNDIKRIHGFVCVLQERVVAVQISPRKSQDSKEPAPGGHIRAVRQGI